MVVIEPLRQQERQRLLHADVHARQAHDNDIALPESAASIEIEKLVDVVLLRLQAVDDWRDMVILRAVRQHVVDELDVEERNDAREQALFELVALDMLVEN